MAKNIIVTRSMTAHPFGLKYITQKRRYEWSNYMLNKQAKTLLRQQEQLEYDRLNNNVNNMMVYAHNKLYDWFTEHPIDTLHIWITNDTNKLCKIYKMCLDKADDAGYYDINHVNNWTTEEIKNVFKKWFESKKTKMPSSTKCCRGTDVRGLCFTCIGNLDEMDDDTVQRVNKCPHTPYAVAYWFYNNHHDAHSKSDFTLLEYVYKKIFNGDTKKQLETWRELCELCSD